MQRLLKILFGSCFLLFLTACASPYYHDYPYGSPVSGSVVRIPPPAPQPPRKVVIRTETHRVLTPKIVMEPCCRMQPDVIYVR